MVRIDQPKDINNTVVSSALNIATNIESGNIDHSLFKDTERLYRFGKSKGSFRLGVSAPKSRKFTLEDDKIQEFSMNLNNSTVLNLGLGY